MRWFSCVALGLALIPTAADAQALACNIPDRLKVPRAEKPRRGEPVRKTPIAGYLLSLSWSPQHCATVRNPNGAREGVQCSGENGHFGWVLHGLWPEAKGADYPQWCRSAKIVPSPVIRKHLCMTPSPQLLQHEWAKHGTCMSPYPAAYFRAAEILFRAVRFPDMSNFSNNAQTAGVIRRAFADANPGVAAPMLSIKVDRQGWLEEIRFCLGPRMRPQRCKPFQSGVGDRYPVRVRAMSGQASR